MGVNTMLGAKLLLLPSLLLLLMVVLTLRLLCTRRCAGRTPQMIIIIMKARHIRLQQEIKRR